ncbi:primosomal protein N' [Spirulina subsalsa FACHB-351]|uniref:Replication restart protein PriA n=1 Tax=Spirulina subsalsa FACHB-351 TaxID=234711 RepID=A0ABT3LB76_9CYAN|nr:primosomal protein N' [Spirulina subsalsa]MCW6038367.1 primosomal protein N' [Spirulina subsalsa FACHB-351]
MSNPSCGVLLCEPQTTYDPNPANDRWLEVLVDCPGIEETLTYRTPPDLQAEAGDIVTVPLGGQMVGGIVVREVTQLPPGLDSQKVREIEDVVAVGFFPAHYWELLQNVADYYYTPFITVVKGALPPGLLQRSQRRIRLQSDAIPPGFEVFCSPAALAVLTLLQSQKQGDYTAKYIQKQIPQGRKGLRDLLKRGWVESYLDYPPPTKALQKQAITLVSHHFSPSLSKRQEEILRLLKKQGGEMWLTDFVQLAKTTSKTLKRLEAEGYVVIEEREMLRFSQDPEQGRDEAKILSREQQQALNTLADCGGFAEVLLHGVTGSGKTEVYLQAIAPLLEQGKSALVLVPEIGLTPQLTDRFRARFGDRIRVYHSALSDGERYDTWRQMLTGEPQVVIGTRSAIFAPLPHLGLIILDEEHDSSFKQTQPAPTYHARTVAQWRAKLENCPLLLGSATPALETWVRVQENPQNSTLYLSLPERIYSRPLPPIEIVDLRKELKQGNRSIFSQSLQTALENLQQNNQQGILFIPRRGHSTFVSCRSCGYVIECPHCDVSLSYHHTHALATELLRCHYCNHTQLQPPQCPECGSPYLKFFGTGTQKVSQELSRLFPELRVIRFDSDTTRTKGSHRALLTQFAQGEADLLVGTQMLTKGLDIAQVTLVGVVAADGLLFLGDYYAAERTFQTLTQVAGRAGRGADPGRVIIQTYSPDHPVIQAVREHNYSRFAQDALGERRSAHYPPYCRLILLRLSGLDEGDVQSTAQWVAQACRTLLGERDYELLGPAPGAIMRINRRYRWQILLKLPREQSESLNLEQLRDLCPRSVSLMIDVDPLMMN